MSIQSVARRDQLDRLDWSDLRASAVYARSADVYALERANESVRRDESARRAHELATIGE